MIKMYIAGEEVVSDKEFAIKEEMLSASSTILNNCYPKSWENAPASVSLYVRWAWIPVAAFSGRL